MPEKTQNRQNRSVWICILMFTAIALAIGLIAYSAVLKDKNENYLSLGTAWNLNSGWYMDIDDGTGNIETVEVSLPFEVEGQDAATIYRYMTVDEMENRGIYFRNNRQSLRIYVDGDEIYQINCTDFSDILDVSATLLVHFPTPKDTVKVELTIYDREDNGIEFTSITYGAFYELAIRLLKRDIFTVVNIAIEMMLAVVLVLMTVIFYIKGRKDRRIISLAAFIIIVCVWGITDSTIVTVTAMSMEVAAVICYLAFMAMPIPIVYFVHYSCKKRYPALLYLVAVCCINVILQCAVGLSGITQLNKTLVITHIIMAVIIIAGLSATREEMRREDADNWIKLLWYAFIELAACTVLSLLAYWFVGNSYYRGCMMTGITIFYGLLLLILLMGYVDEINESSLNEQRADIYKNISLTDGMTGLKNRRAFEEALDKTADSFPYAGENTLFMLDVNGLKKVNDTYGHNCGDELIVNAAKCITESFGPDAQVFRIGGDEFAVIKVTIDDIPDIYTYMDVWIREFNKDSRYELSIARGYGYLTRSGSKDKDISDWKQRADMSMYADKLIGSKNAGMINYGKELTGIIACIISTVEAKDEYTSSHSERVRELSVEISKHLGLSETTLMQVDTAAYLHDIGKVGIPDTVLFKPGRLTDEEYEIMKTHAAIGADIIAKADSMSEISEIIRHHHERYDGKGYPDGLSGTDIPMISRIIAIADSIDAMTTDRCYRKAFNLDYAKSEIEKNLGRMYDPAIGQIALDHWIEIERIVNSGPAVLSEDMIRL